jgi:hypothetical protein
MSSPINDLQTKVCRLNDRRLGKPKDFKVRLQPLSDEVQALLAKPYVMLSTANTDALARSFMAFLDLANAMDVSGEDLLRITTQRVEIDKMRLDQERREQRALGTV